MRLSVARLALAVVSTTVLACALPAQPKPSQAGASGNSTMTSPQAVRIDLTTDPNPPHKGSNVFQVRVAAANGTPLSGAEVTVTFLMPAMPDMGMAAMNVTSKLTDKSGGLYQGKGDLGSGGTWQVTVTVKHSGHVIGTKKLQINAKGGM
jgi:hypothetical protein